MKIASLLLVLPTCDSFSMGGRFPSAAPLRTHATVPRLGVHRGLVTPTTDGSVSNLRMKVGSKLDLNKDGVISYEELKEAPLIDIFSEIDTFKESIRPFRRTVYGHPEWEASRSQSRWTRNLFTLFSSGVAREIWLQVAATTSFALFLVLYNDYSAEIVNLLGIDGVSKLPELSLPILPFTLSSPALSLLLVFRTNQAYSRWWEARACWGSTINSSRDLARQLMNRIPDHQPELKKQAVGQAMMFSRCLTYHLRKPDPKEDEILRGHMTKHLSEKEADRMLSTTHKPMTILCDVGNSIKQADMDSIQKMKIDEAASILMNNLGICERIFKTPIPLVYSRHTGRFLGVWMLLMPLALYTGMPNHWSIVPAAFLIALFQFGIEELGISIEEPFSILPMEVMSNGIEASISEAYQFELQAMEERKASPQIQ